MTRFDALTLLYLRQEGNEQVIYEKIPSIVLRVSLIKNFSGSRLKSDFQIIFSNENAKTSRMLLFCRIFVHMQMNCKVQQKKAIKIYDQKFYIVVLPCLFANPYIGMFVFEGLPILAYFKPFFVLKRRKPV